MSLVHEYHEAHKARLLRLGVGPCRKPPEPTINPEIESLRAENEWLKAQLEEARKSVTEPPPVPPVQRPRPIGNLTIDYIIRTVARFYGVRPAEITSARRTMDIMKPRQVTMFLCRKLTGKSLPIIGKMCGDRDHTTIMHAWRKIEKLRHEDDDLRDELSKIERLLEVAS